MYIYKYAIFVCALFILGCAGRRNDIPTVENRPTTTIVKIDDIGIPKDSGLTVNDSTLNYLITHGCDELAIRYYQGAFTPSDDSLTSHLLHLPVNGSRALRPFYAWCLSEIIRTQDGAVWELTGEPAWSFINRYPKDFATLVGHDTASEAFHNWLSTVEYSGLPEMASDTKRAKYIRNAFKIASRNCVKCSSGDLLVLSYFMESLLARE